MRAIRRTRTVPVPLKLAMTAVSASNRSKSRLAPISGTTIRTLARLPREPLKARCYCEQRLHISDDCFNTFEDIEGNDDKNYSNTSSCIFPYCSSNICFSRTQSSFCTFKFLYITYQLRMDSTQLWQRSGYLWARKFGP